MGDYGASFFGGGSSGAAAGEGATAAEGAGGATAADAVGYGTAAEGVEGPAMAGGGFYSSPWAPLADYAGTAVNWLNKGNQILSAIRGINSTMQPSAPPTVVQPPAAAAPTTTPQDYKNKEQAYYKQLFAGTGQGLPGGNLPPDIQTMIDKNAALIR